MMLACLLALYREFGMRSFPHCGVLLSFVSDFFIILFLSQRARSRICSPQTLVDLMSSFAI